MAQSRTLRIPGEDALTPDGLTVLRQLGVALDEQRQLRVHNHGLVALDQVAPAVTASKENHDARQRQRQRRPAAGSRKGPSRRKGSARRPRQAGATSRVGGDDLRTAYEEQLGHLANAYPTLQTFADDDGRWLLAKSSIITGLAGEATFLVALPYRSGTGPRAWGFWTVGGQVRWIGPRHTNFQDGSVCAFSPDEGVWAEGGDLRTLFDLYTVWALRHLHLEVFGRWPGRQYALVGADPRVQAYYRQRECQADELCGCGSTRRYAECCQPFDLQLNILEVGPLFLCATNGGFKSRQPPPCIVDFIEGNNSKLPRIADVHLFMRSP